MNPITEVIEVDIYETNALYIRANQANKNSRYLAIQLTYHREPYTIPSGITARLQGSRPDGSPILNDGIIEGNTITFELTEYILGISGTANVEVGLYNSKNDTLLTSSTFHLIIPPSATDALKISNTTEFTALINALNLCEQIRLEWTKVCQEGIKNPNTLVIKLNGTNPVSYDGSIKKEINITPSSIGSPTNNDFNSLENRTEKLEKNILDIDGGKPWGGIITGIHKN